MRYVVYVESRSEGYRAYVPGTGVVADGGTREEAVHRIRETIVAHDAGMRNASRNLRGKPPAELVTVNLA
jgi:predicted RNase H-like HicB family nuclease